MLEDELAGADLPGLRQRWSSLPQQAWEGPHVHCLDTVQSVIDIYLSHLLARVKAGDYSQSAYEGVALEVRRFASVHGGKALSDCIRHDLTSWLDLHPTWRSNWTKKRVLSSIIRPFLWAEEEELIRTSPYRMPRHLKLRTRPRRPATSREYVAIFRLSPRPVRRVLFFLRRIGCRTCESREVLWDEVRWDLSAIVRQEHKTSRQQENPEDRVIGLDAGTLRFLRNLYRQRRPGQVHVFVNCWGKPWTRHSFAHHIRKAARAAGIDSGVTAYCLRHSWTCDGLEGGIGQRQLADQLGHTSTSMVSHYGRSTRFRAEHVRRVAEEVLRNRRRNQ